MRRSGVGCRRNRLCPRRTPFRPPFPHTHQLPCPHNPQLPLPHPSRWWWASLASTASAHYGYTPSDTHQSPAHPQMVVGKVRVYALGSPGGVSFAAVNTDPSRAYELTLDASSSLNVRSHRNTLVATTILPPASASPSPLLLLVLLPIDRFESWSYSYKVSCYAPKARVPLPTLPSTAPRDGRPPIAAAPRVAAAPRHPSAAPPPPPAARAVAKARPAGGATATAATATLRPVE